jgi:hypothetical protein
MKTGRQEPAYEIIASSPAPGEERLADCLDEAWSLDGACSGCLAPLSTLNSGRVVIGSVPTLFFSLTVTLAFEADKTGRPVPAEETAPQPLIVDIPPARRRFGASAARR